MKKRSGVLVLGLFLILFSLSFVSADYWTGADYQGYCNPSTKYVSLGHATSYSGKTFSSAAAEKELCTLLPDNVLLNAGSTSTTRLGSVGDTAYCPEGSIVYGFKCLSPGPDCQYNDHLSDIYCVALSGNYDYAYSTSASSKISINCPVGKFVSGYYAVSSDTLQLRCVSITPACVKKTCADYPGQCGTLSDGCGSTRSCVCSADITSNSWKNDSGTTITESLIGKSVNLSVVGTNLLGVEINYTIYNSTNKIVYSETKVSSGATSDSIDWTPLVSGSYTFNASLTTGDSLVSLTLLISSSCSDACNLTDFRLVCSGTNVNKETCGNYDADSCLEYGDSVLNITCGTGQICSIGLCTDVDYDAPESCFSYNTETTCKAFDSTIAKKDVDNYILSSFNVKTMPTNGFCGTINVVKTVALFEGICNYTVVDCKCAWDDSCGKSFNLKRTCVNSSGTTDDLGQCDITTSVQNTCGSPGGKIVQKSTAVWKVLSSDKSYKPEKGVCESKTVDYPCPNTQRLPFFGLWNFIISLSLIAVIYTILNRNRDKSLLDL